MEYNLLEKLEQNRDEEYRIFHSKLCPNIDNILGVRVPKLREIAKEISKTENWQEILIQESKYYEITMIQGLVIGYSKMDIDEKIKLIEEFIPKIDNWAVCDIFCSNLKIKEKDKTTIWQFLNKYLESEDEFILRFVVIMYLGYFLTEEYIVRVLENIEKIKNDRYYTQMGIAWLISVAYVKQKDITIKYLTMSKLDNYTYNKAIQKIIESNRVTKEEKAKIRQFKRLQS